MKILYVVSRPLTINTSASIRNIATILGFKSLGHTVDVITTEADKNHPAYDGSIHLHNINIKAFRLSGKQSLAKYGRKFKFLEPLRVFLYRRLAQKEIYDNLKGIINHTGEVDLMSEKYDIIVSSSDPKSSHLFVLKLLQENPMYKGKWIQIWGDPFAADITNAGINTIRIKEEEEALLAKADKVVYVSRLTQEDQQKRYPLSASKMTYQPVPYIETTIYPEKNLKGKDRIELVYCGDYNSSIRNIEPLVDAVRELPNLHLTVCGNSNRVIAASDNITAYGRVDYSRVKDLESNSDILVHLSNLSGTQIPGKIYHYSATNKPILFILDGDMDKILEQFANYERYEFSLNSREAIINSIQNMISNDRKYQPVESFCNLKVCSDILK